MLSCDRPAPTKSDQKEALAVYCILKYPDRNREEIAEFAGCARTSLYRMPLVRKIWSAQKVTNLDSLHQGARTFNSDTGRPDGVEAWDED